MTYILNLLDNNKFILFNIIVIWLYLFPLEILVSKLSGFSVSKLRLFSIITALFIISLFPVYGSAMVINMLKAFVVFFVVIYFFKLKNPEVLIYSLFFLVSGLLLYFTIGVQQALPLINYSVLCLVVAILLRIRHETS